MNDPVAAEKPTGEKTRLQRERDQSAHVLELTGIVFHRLAQMNSRVGQEIDVPEKTTDISPEPSNVMDEITQNLIKIQLYADQSLDEITRLENVI